MESTNEGGKKRNHHVVFNLIDERQEKMNKRVLEVTYSRWRREVTQGGRTRRHGNIKVAGVPGVVSSGSSSCFELRSTKKKVGWRWGFKEGL